MKPQAPAAFSFLDTALVGAVLLNWTVPAAYFWTTAAEKDAVLPHLPRFLWMLPGMLWQYVPWLLVVGVVGGLLAYHLVRGKKKSLGVFSRIVLVLLFLVLSFCNVWWGGAIH